LNGYTKADVSQRLDVRAAGAKVIDTEPSKWNSDASGASSVRKDWIIV
jgi:hypothetical protein